MTNDVGGTSSVWYDGGGRRTKARVKVDGSTDMDTAFAYDTLSRLTRTTDPAGHHTDRLYDVRGQLTKLTDAEGKATSSYYDDGGRLTAVTDAEGRTVQTRFDALGRRTALVDARSNASAFAYDDAGMPRFLGPVAMRDPLPFPRPSDRPGRG